MRACRLLIVEDQAETRRLIRWGLSGLGHSLYEAANAVVAIQIAKVLKPDLVLLDVVLPGSMDGLDACRQFKQDPLTSDVRILVLSANAEPRDRAMALEAGADAFLAKPFSPVELSSLIEELLNR